ncbi:ER membrane protein complex subunit 5-like [Paramacrobiotus metropolitanus]|uniref:ER membrane protein complex subunit 5-like n=1 Tax=Paramacrobiotus metropolitanus TaxID=2943436 RepID=UPI0024463794|nr:ER membrane protein complex subunit 5-like [Paramacrobiotus metropolitanus]
MLPQWVLRVIFISGSVVLLHSAISAAQHRSFQRINRQVREAGSVDSSSEEPKLPLDIVLETLISMCIVLWAFVHMTFKLKNIRPEAEYEAKSQEALDFRPSFMVFGQRESLYKLRLMDQSSAVDSGLRQRPPSTPVPSVEEVSVADVEDDMPPLEEM